MGGKHKVANRTKNNARPSSSGRSAELLSTSLPQFVGFSGIKDTTYGLGGFSLASTEDIDGSLDSSFQLVLKKISKKDSTTKIKGLQEFAELVKNTDAEILKSVLPVWPRFYNLLATDIDNRVREAAHNVHHQIVLKAKRNIAPFLKQLIAPWFTSQYDTYAPAASIASKAFNDAFPASKFQEAIIFCQEEILSYIKENLIEQTVQTLTNSKTISAEDAEAKYERVIISCLQGYFLYLTKTPSEHIEKFSTLNNDIVSNTKFWKYAKHKVVPVRAAWYQVLTAICQKASFLLDDKGSNVITTVFNNLDESDPTVLPCVWESALLLMTTIKEWWTLINIEKVYLPKLCKILKQGGQGTASVIYPNLLPVVSKVPPSIDASLFYNSFFENLRLGFKQKTVITSRSESAAIATALFECLQYVILQNKSNPVLCKHLIKNHIISTIEWCLLDTQSCHKIIFNQVSYLVQYWSKNTREENYDAYIQFFYANLTDLFKETLFNLKEVFPHNVSDIANKQIEILQCLKHVSKSKKHYKVKFAVDTSEEISSDDSNNKPDELNLKYNEYLNSVVYNISEEYVNYIKKYNYCGMMKHFYSLVLEFDTKNFFINLTQRMVKKNSSFKLIDIFNQLLYKWLVSSELASQHVVDLIFLLFTYVEKDEQELIMRELTKSCFMDSLGWCILQALSHPLNKNPVIQEWLKSDKVTKYIVYLAEKETNDTCTPDDSVLFKLALTENEDGDLLIRKEAITEIVDKLISVQENHKKYTKTIDTCSSLSAYMAAIIYTDNLLLTYGDELLLSLFKLSCKQNIDNLIISTETLYEVSSAWEDAVTILAENLDRTDFYDLTYKFADIIEKEFMKSELDESRINYLSTVVLNYLKAAQKSIPIVTYVLNIFIDRTFTPIQKDEITNLCKTAEYITGNLCSPYEEIITDNIEEIVELDTLKYFAWTYLKINIVSNKLVRDDYVEEVDSEDEEEEEMSLLPFVDHCEEFIASILYDITMSKVLLDNYKNIKHYHSILNYENLIKTKFRKCVGKMDQASLEKLREILKEKAMNQGWLWSKSVYILYTDIIYFASLVDLYQELTKTKSDINNLGLMHLTQTFSKHITFDHVERNLKTVEKIVVLRSLLHCEEIDVQIAEVFGLVESLRSENVPQFLYDSSNVSWEKTQEIIETIRLCGGLIKYKIKSLNRRHWDFGILSLASWSSNILKAKSRYENYQVQAIFTAVVDLYYSTENQIKVLKEENENNNFVREWEDVLVESIHADIAQLWLYLAEKLEQKQMKLIIKYIPLIQSFGKAIDLFKHEYLFRFNDNFLPKWTKFLKRSCSLLVNSLPSLQVWGYKMLLALIPGLIKIDSEAVNTNTPHKKGLIFEQFQEKLAETHDIVNNMLLDFKLGEDSCTVKPSTDSFTYTFAYLLLWDILLSLCEQSSTELRYQYADWLRNEDLLKNFLNNIFRLMPTEILHYSDGRIKALADKFLQKPQFDFNEGCNSEKIETLVCWLYASTLAQLPALVRQWWTAIDTKLSQVVEKITEINVSPHLCNQELTDVTQHQKFKNMVVKTVPSVREVIAIYTVDEAQMELVITLPANYPLSGPEVQCNRQIGGTTHKAWLLQFKKCVLHQNGRIWDGLSIWNNNLDKKFDGVEECYICFAVLHPGTYQLPKLSCQTCKKKFHSACLYKWFSTSNKSSCPICRNLF